MARYAGEIKISAKSGFFVNFYPGYKIVNDEFIYLNDEDLEVLLADSQYLNINLVSTSSSIDLQEFFQDGEDIILDFTVNDLSPNLKGDGSLYPTAWKLDVARLGTASIHHMEDFGYYYAPESEFLPADWQNLSTFDLSNSNISEGMQIVLPAGSDPTTLIGPFKVLYDDRRERLYIRLNSDSKKHLASGVRYEGGFSNYLMTLEQNDVTRDYIKLKGPGISEVCVDQITDEELLDNFCELLRRKPSARAMVPDAEQAKHMLEVYYSSSLSGSNIPKDIIKARRDRLEKMFDANEGFDQALESVARVSGSLLEACQKEPAFAALIEALAGSDDFLEHLEAFEPIVKKQKQLESAIEDLEKEKDELEAQADELRRISPKEQLDAYYRELERVQQLKAQADEALRQSLAKANISQSLADLESRAKYLEEEILRKEQKAAALDSQVEEVQQRLDGMLESAGKRALELSFDNLIASRFAAQSALAARREEIELYKSAARALRHLEHSYFEPEGLVDYLVSAMKSLRPDYSRNEILNLMICLNQGFLTIFAGGPGTGKTSLVRNAARVLGLDKPRSLNAQHPELPDCSRFVQVAVERGWTSRRDFIGFYNSLMNSFDKASVPVFDLLSILDQEARSTICASDLPAMILLDDANLSSMEYYWADFMSMSDEEDLRGTLQLGESYELKVPSSLRFCATVQSDHTTEPLSARLLDRAWVISLPKRRMTFAALPSFASADGCLITQTELKKAFLPESGDLYLPLDIEEQLEGILKLFAQEHIDISTRSEIAIRRYIQTALRWFENEGEGRSAADAALDYAVAQRLLPAISGSGERFRTWLGALAERLESARLGYSKLLLEQIMERGDNSMQFYQFFS